MRIKRGGHRKISIRKTGSGAPRNSSKRGRMKISAMPMGKRDAINKGRRARAAKNRKPLKSQWTRRTKTGKIVTVHRKKFFR